MFLIFVDVCAHGNKSQPPGSVPNYGNKYENVMCTFFPGSHLALWTVFATLLELLNNTLTRLCLQPLWAQMMPLAKMLVL